MDERELAEAIEDFCNTFGARERSEALIRELSRTHRTLQQIFTLMVCKWFEYLASLKEGQYDERNKASVELAKKLVPIIKEHNLPII